MEKKNSFELILDTIRDKSVMKQQVYKNTCLMFSHFGKVLQEVCEELQVALEDVSKVIKIKYSEDSSFERQLKIAGDVLIFAMHTNVFQFDRSHAMWNTSYVREDNYRAFCGVINVYNFLTDSFKYDRKNDSGYLVARIFVNRDMHYFVEGKRQLGILYNDFVHAKLDKKQIRKIVESIILYTLDFDLLTPSYDIVKEVTVSEIEQLTSHVKMRTGKRLGFKFQADTDAID